MTEGRRAPQGDPTGERTADQSAQKAGGLHQDVDRAGVGRDAEDTAYRNDEDLYDTPRRYESADNEDERVMPANDSSVKPKI